MVVWIYWSVVINYPQTLNYNNSGDLTFHLVPHLVKISVFQCYTLVYDRKSAKLITFTLTCQKSLAQLPLLALEYFVNDVWNARILWAGVKKKKDNRNEPDQ